MICLGERKIEINLNQSKMEKKIEKRKKEKERKKERKKKERKKEKNYMYWPFSNVARLLVKRCTSVSML